MEFFKLDYSFFPFTFVIEVFYQNFQPQIVYFVIIYFAFPILLLNVAYFIIVPKQNKVTFLAWKPHLKCLINCSIFFHRVYLCLTTGGNDQVVVLLQENNDLLKPKILHYHQHSSSMKVVTDLQQKKILL